MEKNYKKLFQDVGEKEFDARFAEVQKQIDEFLTASNYISQAEEENHAECNNRILYHVLLDYYSDIRRLKDFHEISHTKTDKNIAYLAYWILRRKPIQIDNLVDKESAEQYDRYIDLLLYFVKYRECSAQMIELLIETFKMGIVFGENL